MANTKGYYPFGNVEWTVTDSCEEEKDRSSSLVTKDQAKTLLAFVSCDDDQFNCECGTCVDMAARCDGINDCSDMSDERNCSIVRPDNR